MCQIEQAGGVANVSWRRVPKPRGSDTQPSTVWQHSILPASLPTAASKRSSTKPIFQMHNLPQLKSGFQKEELSSLFIHKCGNPGGARHTSIWEILCQNVSSSFQLLFQQTQPDTLTFKKDIFYLAEVRSKCQIMDFLGFSILGNNMNHSKRTW